ncbi:unnamed protein product, partial [Discosporangium mesarthrocarpum]
MSERAPLYRPEMPWRLCPQHTCCILNRVLVGYRAMGLVAKESHDSPAELQARDSIYRRFRRFYLDGMPTLRPSPHPPPMWDPLRVVIVQRANCRQISNAEEVAAMLRSRYPGGLARVLQLEAMSLTEQVELLQETSLLIAVEGSGFYGVVLARPGMGVIAIERDLGLPWPEGMGG